MKLSLSLLFLAFALANAKPFSATDRLSSVLAQWILDQMASTADTVASVSSEPDFSHPITAKVYQGVIKQGFSTNYFKSKKPAIKYRTQNIQDVYDMGFRNLRLRCRADLYEPPYTNEHFETFITELTEVVDKCIRVGVAPIISWIHHIDEAYAYEEARVNYITWWTKVAEALKDRNYLLSFNLFTELGIDECNALNDDECKDSLRNNVDKYNQWTSDVVAAIRATGGNNADRILILASPEKTGEGLELIDKDIYQGDDYMMVEWHSYAAGPQKRVKPNGKLRPRYWAGDGSKIGQQQVRDSLQAGVEFSKRTKIPSYFGAWMPQDNTAGALNQMEVDSFARFFVQELKSHDLPWSLNVLDVYYSTSTSKWRVGEIQEIKEQPLDMYRVLEIIKEEMPK